MLGEMLCAGFATQNFSWIGSPAATELETVSTLCFAPYMRVDKPFKTAVFTLRYAS